MRYIFTIVIVIFSYSLQAQTANLEWAKQLSGTDIEVGNSIKIDASGNVYTVGTFQGTADFDPGSGIFTLTAGGIESFITKLDAFGNFVWAKKFDVVTLASLAIDNSGDICIAGRFSGTVDFDPNAGTFSLSSKGSYDIFIAKLSSSGNLIWAASMGGVSDELGRSVTTDASGNIYITGFFMGTADFDPGPNTADFTTAGTYDAFIVKLNSSGTLVWAKTIGGAFTDMANSIAVDALGNVFVTGTFDGVADFDPGTATYNLTGSNDIFILKLGSSGNLIWAKSIGGSSLDEGNSITTDGSGNVYTTGDFDKTVDFDPGPGTYDLINHGSSDIFIVKLDASGNFIWARNMGGTNMDIGSSIALDPLGNVYTTGFFVYTADFDPGPGSHILLSAGVQDIFLSKLNASGNFVWAVQLGGAAPDLGMSVTTDVSGNIYATGCFQDIADFEPGAGTFNLASKGSNDVFIVKLSQAVLNTTTTSLTSSLNPSTVGQSVTFTATVNAPSGKPTGTVTFFDGTTILGTGTLSGNTATFTTTSLPAGSHNITSVYNGSTGYSGSTSSILTQVVTAPITSTTTSVASSLNPSVSGQSVTFTATVTAASGTPTGTVTFFDGTTNLVAITLSGNTATFTSSAFSVGSHNITAVYNGNANYSSSTSTILIQVVTAPIVATTTSVTTSLNPSIVGQSVMFTATVNASTGTPTGTVTFFDGIISLGTGTLSANTATFTTAALVAGSHNITAVYNANSNYSSSTSTILTQVVTAPVIGTTTSVVSSLNPSTSGQVVVFSATVTASSGTPTGTVTFFDGTVNLGTATLSGNIATFSSSSLTVSSHNITAVYNGTSNYGSSTSLVLIQVVTGPSPGEINISITSSLNPSTARENVTFAATVSVLSGTPTGSVSFFDGTTMLGSATIVGSTATFNTSVLIPGRHNITAKYNGDNNFSASTSSILIQTVFSIIPVKLLHLYPNPIHGNLISFQMNMQKGTYIASLMNSIGQEVATKIIQHPDGSSIETIELSKALPAGIYHLKITGIGIMLIRKVVKL